MVESVILQEEGSEKTVYDISLDGTFVNAFGCNVVSNTDGFNFQLPDDSYRIEHGKQAYIVPRGSDEGDSMIFGSNEVLCVRNEGVNEPYNKSIDEIIAIGSGIEVLTLNGWVGLSDIVFDQVEDGYVITIKGEQMYTPRKPQGELSNYRYTNENPYISNGVSRETKAGMKYTGFEADVAEFNDMYMKDFHYAPNAVQKMGLGIDEVVASTINFSRKNYADYFPTKPYPEDVKLVGNTLKSKKIPIFLEKFIDVAVRQLLQGKGQDFIEFYYEYLAKIYNYQIPLREIATKGKIKRSIEEYLADLKTITKAGRPKSRQAWYELAIQNNLHVDNGDTIYYINTGKAKSHNDLKKITHYFHMVNGEKVEFTKEIDGTYKKYKTNCTDKEVMDKQEWIAYTYPNYTTEDEVQMHCMLVPQEIVESEDDTFCNEENGIEYNTAKYIDMFNKRITPLLVCFSRDIRNDILVNNPKDRKYFTKEQCELVSGEPNKPSDQDTYEQLMTMEDKEYKFWTKYGLVPPFFEECGMGNWEDKSNEYLERMEEERRNGIMAEKERFFKAIADMTMEEMDKFEEEGELNSRLMKIVEYDPLLGEFVSKKFPNVVIGSIHDILDRDINKDVEFGVVEIETVEG